MERMGHWVRRATSVLILAALALFAVQNVAAASVAFLLWTFQLPLFVVILLSFAAGVVVGWVYRPLRRGSHGIERP